MLHKKSSNHHLMGIALVTSEETSQCPNNFKTLSGEGEKMINNKRALIRSIVILGICMCLFFHILLMK